MCDLIRPDRSQSPGSFRRSTEIHKSCWDCEHFRTSTRNYQGRCFNNYDGAYVCMKQGFGVVVPQGDEVEKLPQGQNTVADECSDFLLCEEFRDSVQIVYTNWKGMTAIRKIRPYADGLFFGSNEWHPDKQWLLRAFDLDKKTDRIFSMKDIQDWSPLEE